MTNKALEDEMRRHGGLEGPPTISTSADRGPKSGAQNPLSWASMKQEAHGQVSCNGQLMDLMKYDIQAPLNKYKLTSTGLNDYVLDEFSKWLTMPFVSSMIWPFLNGKKEEMLSDVKIGFDSPSTNEARMLEEIFMFWRASERNVVYEIPESTAKRMHKYEINSDILKCDWKKVFFHLSDVYKFDFGGKYDFYLSYSGKKEDEWFNLNYNFLKQRVSEDIDSMFKTVDMERGNTWVINDMFDSKPFEDLPDSKRGEFKRFVLSFLKKEFENKILFSWQAKPVNESLGKEEIVVQPSVGWIWFNSYEGFKKIANDFSEKFGEDDGGEVCINKLLTCLDMLKFSHKREFVTKNKSFTTNMRKAAKGLPRKKEKSKYKELISKKVIELPRKLYLDYTRKKGSGTHASPKPHLRSEVKRTYRDERFAASGLKGTTVTIAPCLVNGGPEKNQETIIKVDPDSNLLEDYLSNYEKNKNG